MSHSQFASVTQAAAARRLQHTATRTATHLEPHCNTHCNTLQHTATHCNIQQHTGSGSALTFTVTVEGAAEEEAAAACSSEQLWRLLEMHQVIVKRQLYSHGVYSPSNMVLAASSCGTFLKCAGYFFKSQLYTYGVRIVPAILSQQ